MTRTVLRILVAALGLSSAAAGSELPLVTDLRVEGVSRRVEGVLRERFETRVGAPFDRSALARDLAWLRARGVYETVDVVLEKQRGEREVVFQLRTLPVLESIDVEGVDAVLSRKLAATLRLQEGELLLPELAERARHRALEYLRQEGYPAATVTLEVRRSGALASLLVRVDAGEARRLRRLDLSGIDDDALRSEVDEAIREAFEAGWRDVSVPEARAAALAALRRRDYFGAEVDLVDDPDAGDLRIEVELGRRYEIVVEGNQHLEATELIARDELLHRPVVTEGTWRQVARRMTERYREAGFALAEVESRVENIEDRRVVTFKVREGRRFEVRRLRVRGNRRIEDARLRSVLLLAPKPWWRGGGWLRPAPLLRADTLLDDLERIRRVYAESGFRRARILELGLTSLEAGGIELTIRVAEGPRAVAGRVTSDGALAALLPADAEFSLERKAATPSLGVELRRRLRRRFGSLGHPEARFTIREVPVENDVRVDYRVAGDPGPKRHFETLLLRSNHFTRDDVILRELPFAVGDPWDPEVALDAQRRLYGLGLFRSVSIEPYVDELGRRWTAVSVGERAAGVVQTGIGFDTRSGFRSFLELGHRNLWGTGRRMTLRGEVNLEAVDIRPDEYLGSFSWIEPWVIGAPVDGSASLTLQRRTASIEEFSIERFAAAVGIRRELFRGLGASLEFELDDSRIFDVAPGAALTGRDTGRLRVVSWNPLLVLDRRDDPFSPSRGSFDSLGLRIAARPFGSEADFVKVVGQHGHYLPLPGDTMLLYSLRGGIAEAMGRTVSVPLSERFFLGGRSTVRGFDENDIGPRSEAGDPIGGDLLVSASVELRVPLLFGFRGAAFADSGAVYLRDEGVDLGGFREAVGLGLRFDTPVGPLSLDYGFKLDRRSGESLGALHFAIGNPF